MKAIKCELCGSNDVVKQDGLYVCQHCGTKYTVDEAKKLMIEGTVSVEGTVKIDDSSKIDTWLSLAKNAIGAGNNQEAYDYANKVLEQAPTSSVAWLIKMKSTTGLATLGQSRTAEVISAGRNVVSFDQEREEEVCLFFLETGVNLLAIAASKADETKETIRDLYRSYFQAYGKQYAINACADTDQPTVHLLEDLGKCAIDLEKAAKEMPIFDNSELVQSKGESFIEAFSHYSYCFSIHVLQYWSPQREAIDKKCDVIKESLGKDFPIAYERWKENVEKRKAQQSSGCYVATAVYGSYNCPQVWTLRRFRDNTLDGTWYGRAFIKTYYAISPTLVRWFGETSWFKEFWRKPLDKLVASLRNKGVEDTPYIDKY